MQGKFDVVFGSFAQTVTDQLDEFGNAVGRSTESLQEWHHQFRILLFL